MSGQLPAYMQNRQPGARSVAQNLVQGIGVPQPPRISIAGNRFSLIDGAGQVMPLNVSFTDQQGQQRTMPATELDVIILGTNQNVSKVYYAGAYDPTGDANQPPACFSDNGVAPSVQAQSPQSPTCAACPNNAWGSRVNPQTSQQSKACSDRKKVAVRLAYGGDPTIYQLQIPPASLKAVAAMVHSLASQDFGGRSADPTDVITRISFVSQGILQFAAVGFYDDATYAQIEHLITTGQGRIDEICGNNDVPRTAALPAPAAAPLALPAPVAQPFQQQPAQVHYSPPPGQQGGFTMPAAQAAPQAPAQPRRRGRGRPPAEQPGVPQQAAQPQGQQFQQPAFVPTGPAQPQPVQTVPTASPPAGAPAFLQPQPVQQVPAQPQQNFGMVSAPAAPDPALSAQLASVFNLPT